VLALARQIARPFLQLTWVFYNWFYNGAHPMS
jgi:hypothetical protein